MTPNELYQHWLRNYPNRDEIFPTVYEVDADTYAQVCEALFKNINYSPNNIVSVSLGPNNGPYFKGVELILKHWHE